MRKVEAETVSSGLLRLSTYTAASRYLAKEPHGGAIVTWSWTAAGSDEKCCRGLRFQMLRRKARDNRLVTHDGHLWPSPDVHGDLGCDHRERGQAGRADCFAERTASLTSTADASL